MPYDRGQMTIAGHFYRTTFVIDLFRRGEWVGNSHSLCQIPPGSLIYVVKRLEVSVGTQAFNIYLSIFGDVIGESPLNADSLVLVEELPGA